MRSMFAVGFVLSVGCGGAGVPGGAPAHGLDPARLVTSLTATEVEKMCGDSITRLGGENHTVSCGGDRQFKASSVGECKASLGALSHASRCDVTVGDIDACSVAQSKDVCAEHHECDVVSAKALACR